MVDKQKGDFFFFLWWDYKDFDMRRNQIKDFISSLEANPRCIFYIFVFAWTFIFSFSLEYRIIQNRRVDPLSSPAHFPWVGCMELHHGVDILMNRIVQHGCHYLSWQIINFYFNRSWFHCKIEHVIDNVKGDGMTFILTRREIRLSREIFSNISIYITLVPSKHPIDFLILLDSNSLWNTCFITPPFNFSHIGASYDQLFYHLTNTYSVSLHYPNLTLSSTSLIFEFNKKM